MLEVVLEAASSTVLTTALVEWCRLAARSAMLTVLSVLAAAAVVGSSGGQQWWAAVMGSSGVIDSSVSSGGSDSSGSIRCSNVSSSGRRGRM